MKKTLYLRKFFLRSAQPKSSSVTSSAVTFTDGGTLREVNDTDSGDLSGYCCVNEHKAKTTTKRKQQRRH